MRKIDIEGLRELRRQLSLMTAPEWHAQGRFISRVSDHSGPGGSLHNNHIATVTQVEDAEGIVALLNAADSLINLAEAGLATDEGWREVWMVLDDEP